MKTEMKDHPSCPQCGRPLMAGLPGGLCASCLLAQGAETEGHGRFHPPPVAEVARLFPQLEILGLIGSGGMGAVFKARQPALDRIVALKVLPAGGDARLDFEERFNREARVVAVDAEGRVHTHRHASGNPNGDSATWTCSFGGLAPEQIQELRVQVRPLDWITFPNISLQPQGSK